MGYIMQSLRDFYCRKCNDQNPKSLSMSWISDDLICPKCKNEERGDENYEVCKEVERMTISPYYKWGHKIILIPSSVYSELYIGEYKSKRFLFKLSDKKLDMYMFIKILKEDSRYD